MQRRTAGAGSVSLAAALLVAGTAPNARAQTDGTATIRGRVVSIAAAGAAPAGIRYARVSINAGAGAIEPSFTDDDGRFVFSRLRAGRYILTAEKTGFVRTRFGATSDLDPAAPIDVADGALVDDIQITMLPGAAITGRVVDELGDPVVGAAVSAGFLPASGTNPRPASASRRGTTTDDRGEYRLGGLAAGRYYVSVAGSTEGATINGAPLEWANTVGRARTVYPAAATIAGATPIVLTTGEQRSGIDVTVASFRSAKVTIRLVDAAGAPATGAVNLLMPGEEPGSIVANRGVPLSPANPQMTSMLEPGEWVAVALNSGGKAIAHVKLSSGEETSVTLVLGAGARVGGRVVFDGSSTPPPLASVRLRARGVGPDAAAPAPGLSNGPVGVEPSGSFELSGVVGTIDLQPDFPLRGWALRAVKYGDRDLLDEPLTLSGTEAISGLQVVFSDRLADVVGTVTDADGRPATQCAVAIFPDDRTEPSRAGRARLVRSDQNGRFSVTDLFAGRYRIIAAPDIDAGEFPARDYLDRLRLSAEPLTLAEHEQRTQALHCTSAR